MIANVFGEIMNNAVDFGGKDDEKEWGPGCIQSCGKLCKINMD